jgi:hypothetical protein
MGEIIGKSLGTYFSAACGGGLSTNRGMFGDESCRPSRTAGHLWGCFPRVSPVAIITRPLRGRHLRCGRPPAVRQATCGAADHLRWGRPPAVRQTLAGGSHGICAGGVSAVGPRFGTASASCCSRGGRKSLCQLPLAGTTIHAEEDAP